MYPGPRSLHSAQTRPWLARSVARSGALFALLTAVFASVAAYSAADGAWVIAAAAGALTLWMGELSFRTLR